MTGFNYVSINNLESTWSSILTLCSGLSEQEWKMPTGCPGWSVQDNIAHLIDYEARALGRPVPDHTPSDLSHTKNALGASNEIGIDARRSREGAVVLDEFREVTEARLAQLRNLTEADLAREVTTPAGPGTLATMLTLRVMDTWSHEQDIRRALGRPGHETGGAAVETVEYLAQFLPIVIAKRAGVANDCSIGFAVAGVPEFSIEVRDGRGRVSSAPTPKPLVLLSMPAPTFAALAGGRSDAPSDYEIVGDADIATRIVNAMGFLP